MNAYDPRVPENFSNLSSEVQLAVVKAYRKEQNSKNGSQIINTYGPTNFGDPSRVKSDFDKCLEKCLNVAVFGENPVSPIQGELKTYAMGKAGQIALDSAKRKGLKTVVVKVGSKAIPGLNSISTLMTVAQFATCAKKCKSCP